MTADPYQLPETGHDWSEPARSRGVVVVALTLLALLAALAGLAVAVYLVTR